MWCAPKLCTTPVLRTGAIEFFLNAPVYAPVQERQFTLHQCICTKKILHHTSTPVHNMKFGAHRCSCTRIFQHRTTSPVHQKEVWCTPVLTPVCTGAYNK